jgi:membrane-bound serine protease (ClpP class)
MAVAAMRRRLAAAFALAAALCALATSVPAQERGAGRVLAIELEGPVSPVMAAALRQALDRAESQDYAALLVRLDTPGGLEPSMRDMVKRILAADVPVIVWVAPSGARAASAGVFIAMAADVAAMAPGTNIGAATPVQMQGAMDSTMARKASNDAAAFARTIAARRARNVEWAEDAVRRAVSASETEAVELDIVDFVAGTEAEVLARADDRPWRGATIRLEGLPVDHLAPGFRLRLLAVLADPNVAYILLMLGFYGLLFELQNPGAILPGVVGGICIILAFFALSTLPVNYAGIALIVLAIVFFLAEVKVQSHGLLGAGGVLALLLGSLFLFEGEGVRVSFALILGATAATAAFFSLIVAVGLRAQKRAVTTGAGGLVGVRALVLERLAPDGRVRVGDEIWNAHASADVEAGEEVEVVGVDRLTLQVRPLIKVS